MRDRICAHEHIVAQSLRGYCADCDEAYVNAFCEHKNLKHSSSFIHCVDCGEVIRKDALFESLALRGATLALAI
ncbi:MAG: hypothetical protein FWH34_06775 [Desulfovibrionaceae bacterium]|nr:hypothetical protein [Desulfovibrionaceae bacterium]